MSTNQSSEDEGTKNNQVDQSTTEGINNEEVQDAVELVTVKDVATNLNSSISTITRYATVLEKTGYRFTKRGKARLYSDEDQSLIERMLKCTEQLGLSVERAAITALENDQSLNQQLNDITKTYNQNEVALRDFSTKLNEMFEMISDKFTTKSEINNLTQLLENVVDQDTQKNEIIEKQNDLILKLEEEHRKEKAEKELIQEQFKETMNLYKKTVEDNERFKEIIEDVRVHFENEPKKKKKLFGLF